MPGLVRSVLLVVLYRRSWYNVLLLLPLWLRLVVGLVAARHLGLLPQPLARRRDPRTACTASETCTACSAYEPRSAVPEPHRRWPPSAAGHGG